VSQLALANLDSVMEKTIYSVVHKRCSSKIEEHLQLETWWDSTKGSFHTFNEMLILNVTPAVQLYRDRGLSPTTSTILASMGLHVALKDCFGDNQDLKNRFVMNMIVADIKGRVLGTAAGVVSFVLIGKVFAFILKKAYSILLITPFGKTLNPARSNLHIGVIGGVAIAGLLTPEIISLYNKKQTADQRGEAELKEYQEILELAHQEMTRVQNSEKATCEKATEAFEIAMIIQDVYKSLKQRNDAKSLVSRFESLHEYSLKVKTCPSRSP